LYGKPDWSDGPVCCDLVYHYHHHIWISAPEAIPQCLIHSAWYTVKQQ